jgi:hypothetical protein
MSISEICMGNPEEILQSNYSSAKVMPIKRKNGNIMPN